MFRSILQFWLIWSVITLGHLGLLRPAECKVPSKKQFNKSKHLVYSKHILLGDLGFKKLPDRTEYVGDHKVT